MTAASGTRALRVQGAQRLGAEAARACLVVGDAPGATKVTKARELGVPMVSAEQFQRLLNTGTWSSQLALRQLTRVKEIHADVHL